MTQTLTRPRPLDPGRHRPARSADDRPRFRTDVQGLRAVAVASVLTYHLWPNRLPGGFAGVDVFFVISGFLITSQLLARPPRGIRDLAAFWSRRIRRLLPASLLVLAVTLVAARLVAPATQWENTARQVKAAALYGVNWQLAGDSVDYLAAQNAPTAVQHFWSLSVEEQFYLVWPVLILLALAAAALLHVRRRWTVGPVLAAVVSCSLVYSVTLTATDPARAYFVTGTRMWELGLGGLLAAALMAPRLAADGGLRLPPALRAALAWSGLGAVAVTVVTYSSSLPFPSWRALLPTLGTAAVIAAAPPRTTWSPGRLLALRPVQWLGDVSYSVYLWHWPLVVLVPWATGGGLRPLDKLAIGAVTMVLAALTKRFVEDPFRHPRWGRPLLKPFLLAALGMALVVGGTALQTTEVHHRQQADQARVASVNRDVARVLVGHHHSCIGAAALVAPAGTCPSHPKGPVVPDPVHAAADKSDAYASVNGKKGCFANVPNFPMKTCRFGAAHATVHVALVGNSHAGHWLTPLEALASRERWDVTTYVASQCALADVPQQLDTSAHSAACRSWVRRVTAAVTARHYDLVVMSNRVSVPAGGAGSVAASQNAYRRGYQAVLARLRKASERVLVIRDTPAPMQAGVRSIPDCLAAHTGHYAACDGTRAKWVPADPVTAAVRRLHDAGVVYADMTRYLCAKTRCAAVVGGVVVYFDGSHMTATYARTVAPYLLPKVTIALRAPR